MPTQQTLHTNETSSSEERAWEESKAPGLPVRDGRPGAMSLLLSPCFSSACGLVCFWWLWSCVLGEGLVGTPSVSLLAPGFTPTAKNPAQTHCKAPRTAWHPRPGTHAQRRGFRPSETLLRVQPGRAPTRAQKKRPRTTTVQDPSLRFAATPGG